MTNEAPPSGVKPSPPLVSSLKVMELHLSCAAAAAVLRWTWVTVTLWTRGDSFFCCTHLFPVSICVIAPHSPYPVPRGLIFERSSLLFKKTNKTCAFVSLCLRLVDRPRVETVGESLRKPIIFNYSFIFIHSRVRRADAGTLGEDVVTPGHH